jgi:Ca-activated chloride channel family protein
MRKSIWILCAFTSLAIMLFGTSCSGGSGKAPDAAYLTTQSERPAEEDSAKYQGQESLDYQSGGEAAREYTSPPGAGAGLGISPPPAAGGTDIPNAEPYDLTFFENYGVNPFISTEDERTSTFGMDVDTASYVIARRFLTDGNMPDPDSVRTEEFINYFDQDYEDMKGDGVFSVAIEGAQSEFGRPNYHLLRIGVKATEASLEERPAANMIFVVDVSGSMNREDRLEQVKRSLRMLAGNLKRGDRIGLVVYGSTGQVISDLTSDHDAILSAIAQLTPGGSTNAEEGLRLAYEMARRNLEREKVNRIILCSDGVANVGVTDADTILRQIKADALDGITLTTIGFGMGNYNDVLMEKLANHGDGMYYYVDSDDEARRVFGEGAAQMLMVLASDAKVQVEFNEETVDRFRLLGYENRRLTEEQFRDDTVDAGEVGAGQCVTALYEVRVRDESLDDSRAQIATVRIRYEDLRTREIEEFETPVTVRDLNREFDEASDEFRFIAAVAEFAEVLKNSYWAQDGSLSGVLRTADASARNDQQREFCGLVETAIRLEDAT